MKPSVPIADVLIVGSGAAGLMFAAHISKYHQVHVITKDTATESNTRYAQGGIAAVLSIDDSYAKHIDDTLRAGDGLSDPEAVNILVKEAPARIFDLMCMGVDFDRLTDNALQFTREGGHSGRRVIHVGDMTGQAIESALWNSVIKENICVSDHRMVTRLLVRDNICYGVESLDKSGKVCRSYAKSVFLATGGAGQMFAKTTNPEIATGDGFVMAAESGADMMHLEFIQFHPTALAMEGAPCFLISEATRGEGGLLLTIDLHRFMHEYHAMAELAPRDIVSRAIVAEMEKTSAPHVFLDLTGQGREYVEKRFPTITQTVMQYGLHPGENRLPVAPAAHYMCGGVKTDIDGRTSIQGLYAGGEVACTGVHGANRLASNSLLESVVFAYRAAVNADRRIRYLPESWYDGINPFIDEAPPEWNSGSPEDGLIADLTNRLQVTNWKHCGIIRSDRGLQQGLNEIERIEGEFRTAGGHRSGKGKALALANLIKLSKRVYESAAGRRINAGAHYNVNCANSQSERDFKNDREDNRGT
ncbi:L-aspartate oxidase [bacterium]|nr:L-aspartate oxidase [candidate division CSSED10-310 bacterium]